MPQAIWSYLKLPLTRWTQCFVFYAKPLLERSLSVFYLFIPLCGLILQESALSEKLTGLSAPMACHLPISKIKQSRLGSKSFTQRLTERLRNHP